MEEKEAIQDVIKSREKSIRFFSNSGKQETEIWVVREFLQNLGIAFSDNELQSVQDDPPDVVFRDAVFEIKEVDEEGRKRHDEYKKKLEEAKSASVYRDLMTPYKFKEIALPEAMQRIEVKLKGLDYEPEFCRKIDILFYINFSLIGQHCYTIPGKNILEKWRSVSMVANNNISSVLWVTEDSPEFLRLNKGKVIVRGRYAE